MRLLPLLLILTRASTQPVARGPELLTTQLAARRLEPLRAELHAIPELKLADVQLVQLLGHVYASDSTGSNARLFLGLLATRKLREQLLGESLERGDQKGPVGGKVTVKEFMGPVAISLAEQVTCIFGVGSSLLDR